MENNTRTIKVKDALFENITSILKVIYKDTNLKEFVIVIKNDLIIFEHNDHCFFNRIRSQIRFDINFRINKKYLKIILKAYKLSKHKDKKPEYVELKFDKQLIINFVSNDIYNTKVLIDYEEVDNYKLNTFNFISSLNSIVLDKIDNVNNKDGLLFNYEFKKCLLLVNKRSNKIMSFVFDNDLTKLFYNLEDYNYKVDEKDILCFSIPNTILINKKLELQLLKEDLPNSNNYFLYINYFKSAFVEQYVKIEEIINPEINIHKELTMDSFSNFVAQKQNLYINEFTFTTKTSEFNYLDLLNSFKNYSELELVSNDPKRKRYSYKIIIDKKNENKNFLTLTITNKEFFTFSFKDIPITHYSEFNSSKEIRTLKEILDNFKKYDLFKSTKIVRMSFKNNFTRSKDFSKIRFLDINSRSNKSLYDVIRLPNKYKEVLTTSPNILHTFIN